MPTNLVNNRMRPKPSSKQPENIRQSHGVSESFITPGTPTSMAKAGEMPWSGVAAGSSIISSNNSQMPLSSNRSANNHGRSTPTGSSFGRGSSHFTTNSNSKNATSRSKFDEIKENSQDQSNSDKHDIDQVLLENSGGRSYTVNEMLAIWEEMKHNNVIKPSSDQKNDLFHSVLPNQPAIIDPIPQPAPPSESQHQHDVTSNGDSLYNISHTNHSTASLSSINNGTSTPFADRLLSAKPSMTDLHKENGFTQHKQISPIEAHINSPSTSTILPGGSSSNTWSPFGASAVLSNNSESVFKSSGILPKSDLMNNGIGFHSSTPPPGIPSPSPVFVNPEHVNWIYKDPTGQEQGPFNGLRMQEWYSSNWLQESLSIRRADESEYYTLKEFMIRINNFTEPFLVSLPPVRAGGLFENSQQRLQEEIFARQRRQQMQFPGLQMQSSGGNWGPMSPITTPMSPMSHWAQPQPLSANQMPFDFGGLSGSQVNLTHLNNDVWQPRAPGSIPQTPKRIPSSTELDQTFDSSNIKNSLLNELEDTESPAPVSLKDLDNDDEFVTLKTTSSVTAIQPPSKASPLSPTTSEVKIDVPKLSSADEQQIKEKESTIVAEPLKKTKSSKSKSKKTTQSSSTSRSSFKPVPVVNEELTISLESIHITQTSEPSEPSSPVSESALFEKPVSPVLAPWANKDASKPKTPSLKEIQEMEAAERKSRKAHQLQHQAAVNAAILHAARTSNSSSSTSPALPSGATWATVGVSSSTPKKTLAQIQKEEEEAAKKRSPNTVIATKRYSDVSVSPVSSLHRSQSAVASSASSASVLASGGAWTTVGPGGKKVGSNTSPAAPPPIQVAIPVKNEPVRSPVTPSNGLKLSAASEEFLNWCKSSLVDLQTGVNHTELLSMLFSLPASSESKEIISETIYSSSTTMDGRRFAEEFLKRRKAADNEIAGGSWSDILQKTQSATKPVSDGWNGAFKVVSKKKGRRD